eukprot:SM002114S06707  [mRNA]  locus=s2114:46:710:+ [translate_table: standard]
MPPETPDGRLAAQIQDDLFDDLLAELDRPVVSVLRRAASGIAIGSGGSGNALWLPAPVSFYWRTAIQLPGSNDARREAETAMMHALLRRAAANGGPSRRNMPPCYLIWCSFSLTTNLLFLSLSSCHQ